MQTAQSMISAELIARAIVVLESAGHYLDEMCASSDDPILYARADLQRTAVRGIERELTEALDAAGDAEPPKTGLRDGA